MGLGDFGAIFCGTEKPDPTAARLCTKNTRFPVWCMRPAREPRAVLAVGRVPQKIFAGEIPQPHVSTQRVDQTTDKQTIKKASKHITVSPDFICYAIRRSSCLTTRG